MNAHQLLAAMIRTAVDLRESSYDRAAALRATNDTSNRHIDFMQFYGMSLEEATRIAGTRLNAPELATPVYLLLRTGWNDVIDWADQHPQPH